MLNRSTPPVYIPFEDPEVWRIICENYGDTNETVITEGENNTVNITVTLVQKRNRLVTKRTVISTQENVDNSQGTYTVGTTTEPVGITKKQCEAVTAFPSNFFKNNTDITSFMELKYFINMHTMSYDCFDGCTNLTDVDLSNVTDLRDYAFRYTSNLIVHNLGAVSSIGKESFRSSGITYIDLSNISVPQGIGYSKLITVILNNNLTSLLQNLFYSCYNLENINLPDTITSIGDSCFAGCNKIKLYKLPDSLEYLGYRMFNGCNDLLYAGLMNTNLTTFRGDIVRKGAGTPKFIGLTLPATVTTLYLGNYYYTPDFLRCYATTPPTATDTVSGQSTPTTFKNIYVPDASVDLYKAADIWSKYADIIYPMSQWATDAQTNGWQDVQSGLVWDREEQ